MKGEIYLSDNYKLILGANLKILMSLHSVSQQVLSEKLATTRTVIARIQAGEVGISLNTFLKIAEYFRISPPILLERSSYEDLKNAPEFFEYDVLGVFLKNVLNSLHLHQYPRIYLQSQGVSSGTLNRLFNRKNNPNLATLVQISQAIAIDLPTLLKRGE